MTRRARNPAPLLIKRSTLGEMKREELKRQMTRSFLLPSAHLISSHLILNPFILQDWRGVSRSAWQTLQLRVTHPRPKSSKTWRTPSPWLAYTPPSPGLRFRLGARARRDDERRRRFMRCESCNGPMIVIERWDPQSCCGPSVEIVPRCLVCLSLERTQRAQETRTTRHPTQPPPIDQDDRRPERQGGSLCTFAQRSRSGSKPRRAP